MGLLDFLSPSMRIFRDIPPGLTPEQLEVFPRLQAAALGAITILPINEGEAVMGNRLSIDAAIIQQAAKFNALVGNISNAGNLNSEASGQINELGQAIADRLNRIEDDNRERNNVLTLGRDLTTTNTGAPFVPGTILGNRPVVRNEPPVNRFDPGRLEDLGRRLALPVELPVLDSILTRPEIVANIPRAPGLLGTLSGGGRAFVDSQGRLAIGDPNDPENVSIRTDIFRGPFPINDQGATFSFGPTVGQFRPGSDRFLGTSPGSLVGFLRVPGPENGPARVHAEFNFENFFFGNPPPLEAPQFLGGGRIARAVNAIFGFLFGISPILGFESSASNRGGGPTVPNALAGETVTQDFDVIGGEGFSGPFDLNNNSTPLAGTILDFSPEASFLGDLNIFDFATGGRFTVGGVGGTDSQFVAFKASPNERVTVEPLSADHRFGGEREPEIIVVQNDGGDRVGMIRLEQMIRDVNGSIEHRAIAAVRDGARRHPALMRF